jgi:hypothetical protein
MLKFMVLYVAQAYVAAAAERSMKEQLQSCAARIAAGIQNVSSDMDPEILQLPGGSLIATLLWLYAKSSVAFRKH